MVTLIIGSLLGFFFGQAERLLKSRGERRGIYGKALSALLDARVEVIALRKLDSVYDDNDLPAKLRAGAKGAIAEKGAYGKPRERYSKALERVAELDPILAIRLRRSDWIGYYLQVLRVMNVLEYDAIEQVVEQEGNLAKLSIRDLESPALTVGSQAWLDNLV